jgi:ATP-dependent Clp protease ATP-binding subunit ClpA
MEVEKQVGTGPDQKVIGNIPYTPRVKKVLALASKEAKNLKHAYIGTEHILLGLLREGDGVAGRVLKNLGVDIEQTRLEILRELDPNFGATPRKLVENDPKKAESFSQTLSSSTESVGLPAGELTPRAQQVLALARKEADRLKHTFVGAEHLLLGIIALGNGVAANVLLKVGLDMEKVRAEVEKQVRSHAIFQQVTENIPYSRQAKRVLASAAEEARTLNHTYVGTEHILLGLLEEDEGGVPQIFSNFGVDVEKTRLEILKELDPNLGE